jgi:hypothetical protein
MLNSATLAASPLQFSKLIPPRTDRAALIGQTGSGKTTLARYLLNDRTQNNKAHTVVFDYKGRIDWPEFELCTTLSKLAKSKAQSLLYRPTYEESQDEEIVNRAWEWLYRRGGTTAYIDELSAISNGEVFPYYYGACLVRGRELGVEVWSATQRPTRIPQQTLSESENVYCFKLRLPQDRERVEATTGINRDAIAALNKREFLFSRQDGETQGPITLRI